MVCLRNICIDTLHKGYSIFNNNINDNDNNNNKSDRHPEGEPSGPQHVEDFKN
jgi:hypothetical protein